MKNEANSDVGRLATVAKRDEVPSAAGRCECVVASTGPVGWWYRGGVRWRPSRKRERSLPTLWMSVPGEELALAITVEVVAGNTLHFCK